MMHVDYKLNKSKVHGIGLFTETNIKKGQLIYTASPLLDLNITVKQFNSLSTREQKEVRWWGFFDKSKGRWHVDFDVSKFINHSVNSNVTQDGLHKDAYLLARRDIKKGEELTQNYLEFETEEELRKRGVQI